MPSFPLKVQEFQYIISLSLFINTNLVLNSIDIPRHLDLKQSSLQHLLPNKTSTLAFVDKHILDRAHREILQKTINVNCKTHNGNSQIHIVTKFPLMGIL